MFLFVLPFYQEFDYQDLVHDQSRMRYQGVPLTLTQPFYHVLPIWCYAKCYANLLFRLLSS